MNLDIEAMAQESGIVQARGPAYISAGLGFGVRPEHLEAFARLIVERCAVECDSRIHAGDAGAALSAAAIRNLLED